MALIVMNPLEKELQNLKCFDNLTQLDILNREVAYITINGINPCDDWFDDRFEYIYIYSQLSWDDLAGRFKCKDKYIYDTSMQIIQLIGRLKEERSIKKQFYIPTYHTMIFHVKNVWEYYNKNYICGESDIDVVDLVEGMTFL